MSKQKEKRQRVALTEIAKLTDEATKLIRQAEEIAKANEVSFDFDVAYGMGGTFYGAGYESDYNPDYNERVGWAASSHSC